MSREFLLQRFDNVIIAEMSEANKNREFFFENFPLRKVLTRWVLASAEMGIASYFVFKFGFQSGLLFLIYGFAGIFVLLPMIRCRRCFYYGRVCNFGLGKWASFFFPEAKEKLFPAVYGYTVFLWPLRIIPLMLGLIPIIGVLRFGLGVPSGRPGDMINAVISGLMPIPHGLYIFYIIIIYLHRKFYRSRSCPYCYHRSDCPVYDKNSLLSTIVDKNSI